MYAAYFKEIFQSSKTVIIPGLGSFTKTDESHISFNPYLKFNDGYLAGFIAKKQGVSIDEAGKSIGESVDKIQEALNSKGEALVLGLGILKKGADGKISFTAGAGEEKSNSADVKKVAEPVKKEVEKPVEVTKPRVEYKIEKKIVEKSAEPVKPKIEIRPVKKEVEKPIEAVEKKVEEKIIPKIEPVVELKKEVIPEVKVETKVVDVAVSAPKLTEVTNEKKDKNTEKLAKEEDAKKVKLAKEEDAAKAKQLKLEKDAEAKKVKEEAALKAKEAKEIARLAKLKARGERKKRKFPIWLMIVLVLVIGGGTFTALKWEMVKGWLGMNEKAKTEIKEGDAIAELAEEPKEKAVEEVAPVDTAVVKEEPVVEEVKTEPVIEEKVVPVPTSNGNFHIITGNFTNQEYATKMVEKLNAEGHSASNLGQRGGFFMVSAGDFSSMEEAKSKWESIKATYPKAYIYNGL